MQSFSLLQLRKKAVEKLNLTNMKKKTLFFWNQNVWNRKR